MGVRVGDNRLVDQGYRVVRAVDRTAMGVALEARGHLPVTAVTLAVKPMSSIGHPIQGGGVALPDAGEQSCPHERLDGQRPGAPLPPPKKKRTVAPVMVLPGRPARRALP
jgi:hypothetical protein